MVERTPEEIKNAGKAFTPEEIAEGKAKRDELWAREPVPVEEVIEVVAEVEESTAGIPQGAPETEVRGESQRVKPKPKRGIS